MFVFSEVERKNGLYKDLMYKKKTGSCLNLKLTAKFDFAGCKARLSL